MRAILTLHSVDNSGSVISMRPDQLDSLLDAVLASGHTIVSLRELLRTPGVPDRVAITFDDGLASVAEEALPLLLRRGLPATVFVVTEFVGTDNQWPSQPPGIPKLPSMGWGELEALQESGWEIGSHTATHPDPRALSSEQFSDEIGRAQRTLVRHLGQGATSFAWPYGQVIPARFETVSQEHTAGFGGVLAPLDSALDHPLCLPRLDGYYLRAPAVHRQFGRAPFLAFLAMVNLLRQCRRPETEQVCV